ncbi:MAG: glycosyltransferase [Rhodothermales bacterium]
MRILHIMPSVARSFGGPTQSLVGYVDAARAVGLSTTVAAPACQEADRAWLEAQLPGTDIQLFPGMASGTFMASPALIGWMKAHAGAFDVVHVHGLLNLVSSLAARTAVSMRRPLVVRPFGTLSRYTFAHRRAWLKHGYFRTLDRPNLRRARGLHFTTGEERDEAEWHRLGLRGRSFVVPPPLALPPPVDADSGLDRGEDVVFLSRLHPKKNVEGLLRAWPHVLERAPAARLTIAGDGEPGYVSQLHALAASLGIADRVHFAGFVHGAAKTRLLDRSRLFVLPSFQENFGVAVLEAIAAGLPVVIAPAVQLASFVERHRLGRVVDPEPAGLAGAIAETLADRASQARCRQEGPRLVADTFSPEAVGQQLLTMYENVLDPRHA